jgi:hypothetical protein
MLLNLAEPFVSQSIKWGNNGTSSSQIRLSLFAKEQPWLGMVAHAFNPSYSRVRDQRIMIQDQPVQKKVSKTLSQPISGCGGAEL